MTFDISRLRRADQIVGVSAIAFFIFLFFFKWFGGSVSGTLPTGTISSGVSWTGWHTFTNSRWLWLLTIIVALGSVVLVAGQGKLEIPIAPGSVVAGLGALSALFILYRIIHHPSAATSFGGVTASYGIKIGIWLGLIAALGITYGGYLQMQEQDASTGHPREGPSGAFTGLTAPGGAGSPGASPQTRAAPVPPPPAPTPATTPPAAAPRIPPPVTPAIPPPATPPVPGSKGETPGEGPGETSPPPQDS
jgi:hypothetical protein